MFEKCHMRKGILKMRLVIERCLSIVSLVGLGIGFKKKSMYWLTATIVSAAIRLGMGIQRLIDDMDEDE